MDMTQKFEATTLVMVKRRKKYKKQSRAIIAKEAIKEGTIIEKCPVIRIPYDEVYDDDLEENAGQNPTVSHYCFNWPNDFTALALGYGSLYNHSKKPNASYMEIDNDCLVFTAIKDIKKGEEVTIDYQPDEIKDMEFSQKLEQ
jgi:SET domain-containing protein